jgi:AcrR family transcriptional regulator
LSAPAPPKPKRLSREEKKAQTRERLLEAAARVFIRRGFSGSSVEEIAAEAGFTRGAFYSNFSSKEELFIELLHERVFEGYRELLLERPEDLSPLEQLRWGARELAKVQEEGEDRWLFELWLECLAHAARDPEFRSLAATFWSGNRALNAGLIEQTYRQIDREPPIEPKHIATALTALDIGLALQHLVDPEEVPLHLYPKLYELLFAPLIAPQPG